MTDSVYTYDELMTYSYLIEEATDITLTHKPENPANPHFFNAMLELHETGGIQYVRDMLLGIAPSVSEWIDTMPYDIEDLGMYSIDIEYAPALVDTWIKLQGDSWEDVMAWGDIPMDMFNQAHIQMLKDRGLPVPDKKETSK